MHTETSIISLLQAAGFRRTPARIAALTFLSRQPHPVGIDAIAKHLHDVNIVTLYRMMDDFAHRGLVTTHEIGHGHVDYEFAQRKHHHHAICETCGKIEDVFPCKTSCLFERAVLKTSKEFAKLTHQATAFYGVCRTCSTAK